jgi:hypothetical protein
MSKKKSVVQDQFYIASIHGKNKGGKTGNIYNRFGGSSYNMGSFDNSPSYVYFAVPSVVFPIDRLEVLYKREFADYLIPKKKNFKQLTEYVNPIYTQITIDVIKDAIESFIKIEKLPIMRLKKEYLMTCQVDKDFAQTVRDDPYKYLETI